ncbi:MAG: ABC transporter permease [Alistipes sp.]|nr:ABC transporter permease [Alistipes sp.]
MSQTAIIIGREFNERVRKKSFILSTILMPVFVIAMMVIPSLIMFYAKGGTKTVAVVDESGVIAPQLESDDDLMFVPVDAQLDSVRENMTEIFGILYIGAGILENPNDVRLYTNGSSAAMVESAITERIEDIIESEKLKQYDIHDLQSILAAVKTSVSLSVFRNEPDSEDELSSSTALSAGVGFALGMILYMFLIIYGAMVMQSVIEEKSSRVLEVMVSSVRPYQLMLGKILGVAAVAAVQIVIWGVLICGTCAVALPMIIPSDVAESVEAFQSGAVEAVSADVDMEVLKVVSTLSDTGYVASIFAWLLLFMVGGYLLYSALFAAIGSSVDSVQDASQFQTILMMPIIISIFVMMTIMNDPASPVAVWCSYIPFTSPIVMMARIPSGVPLWEIAVSLIILYATFAGTVWAAAKIYRVGIFMYGKKPTFKELWKWMRYKY